MADGKFGLVVDGKPYFMDGMAEISGDEEARIMGLYQNTLAAFHAVINEFCWANSAKIKRIEIVQNVVAPIANHIIVRFNDGTHKEFQLTIKLSSTQNFKINYPGAE